MDLALEFLSVRCSACRGQLLLYFMVFFLLVFLEFLDFGSLFVEIFLFQFLGHHWLFCLRIMRRLAGRLLRLHSLLRSSVILGLLAYDLLILTRGCWLGLLSGLGVCSGIRYRNWVFGWNHGLGRLVAHYTFLEKLLLPL